MKVLSKASESTDVKRVIELFDEWRRKRGKKQAIPEALWMAAAELANRHGVGPVCAALRLNHVALRDRVRTKAARIEKPGPFPVHFVELVSGEGEDAVVGGNEVGAVALEQGIATESMARETGAIGVVEIRLRAANGARLLLRLPDGQKVNVMELVTDFWASHS